MPRFDSNAHAWDALLNWGFHHETLGGNLTGWVLRRGEWEIIVSESDVPNGPPLCLGFYNMADESQNENPVAMDITDIAGAVFDFFASGDVSLNEEN